MLFKTLLHYISHYKLLFTFFTVGVLFELIFQYFSALSFKFLLDEAIIPQNASMLYLVLILLVSAGLLSVIIGIANDYALAKLSNRMLSDMRTEMFTHIQKQSVDFYSRFRTSDIISRFNVDIPAVELAMYRIFSIGLPAVLSIFIGMSILFFLSWQLTLICLIGTLFFFLPVALLGNKEDHINGAYLEELERVTHTVDENVRGHKLIHGFNLRKKMVDRFNDHMKNLFSLGIKRHFLKSNIRRLPDGALIILRVVILGYGGYLTFQGQISVGSFIAFHTIFLIVGQSIYSLTNVLPGIIKPAVNLRRLYEIFDHHPAVTSSENPILMPAFSESLTFNQVSFSYDANLIALKNIDMTIPANQYTVIVGASGSGKSTLLQLMLRFYDPGKGAVLYDNHDLKQIDRSSLSNQLSVVFQDPFLFNSSIRENIAIGHVEATEDEIIMAAKEAKIHDRIMSFKDGYDTKIDQASLSLSGGERQRLAIARALVKKPNILFLDEATSALDPETESEVHQTLQDVSKGRTVISFTHRLSQAIDADQVIVIEDGQVAKTGTHHQLIKEVGIYKRMWDKQTGFSLIGNGTYAKVDADRLSNLPFFQQIHPDVLQELSDLFITETYEAGKQIITEGEQGHKLYIIVRGRLSVSKRHEDGTPHRVAVLEDGDYFGEIALLKNTPRNASIESLTPSICITLSRELFNNLITKHPEIKTYLEQTLGERMT